MENFEFDKTAQVARASAKSTKAVSKPVYTNDRTGGKIFRGVAIGVTRWPRKNLQ